jgi:hypothetical protein
VQEAQPARQVGEDAGLLGADQRHRDDAHGLLRIVVAVGEAHVRGREDLRLAEERVDPARTGHPRQRAAGVGHRR